MDSPMVFPLGPDDLPPIDFGTFIVSLRASALMHLAATHEPEALALARQEIDLLGILEEKTRGNLTAEEQSLLREILFELRTRYVAARQTTPSGRRTEDV